MTGPAERFHTDVSPADGHGRSPAGGSDSALGTASGSPDAASTAVRTRALTRRFDAVLAVDAADLDVPTGGVVGIVGPNGSGKSTTIRMLVGLIAPSSGTAHVLDRPVEDQVSIAPRVGALIDSPAFVPSLTARANLRSLAALRGLPESRVTETLAIVGLTDRADHRVAGYSLGMKQRLAIALALLPDPDLLILDEPTNGLDPAGIIEIRDLIRRLASQGRTVLVSSHLLSELQAMATHMVLIQDGRIRFCGPMADLLATARTDVVVRTSDSDSMVALRRRVVEIGGEVTDDPDPTRASIVGLDPSRVFEAAVESSAALTELRARQETLEELFIRLTTTAG